MKEFLWFSASIEMTEFESIKVAKSIARLAMDLYISFFYVLPKGSTGFSSIFTKWKNIVYEVFSPRTTTDFFKGCFS